MITKHEFQIFKGMCRRTTLKFLNTTKLQLFWNFTLEVLGWVKFNFMKESCLVVEDTYSQLTLQKYCVLHSRLASLRLSLYQRDQYKDKYSFKCFKIIFLLYFITRVYKIERNKRLFCVHEQILHQSGYKRVAIIKHHPTRPQYIQINSSKEKFYSNGVPTASESPAYTEEVVFPTFSIGWRARRRDFLKSSSRLTFHLHRLKYSLKYSLRLKRNVELGCGFLQTYFFVWPK